MANQQLLSLSPIHCASLSHIKSYLPLLGQIRVTVSSNRYEFPSIIVPSETTGLRHDFSETNAIKHKTNSVKKNSLLMHFPCILVHRPLARHRKTLLPNIL